MTLRQRYLPKAYLGLWLIFLASVLATCSISISARSYDPRSAHIVPHYVKGGGINGFITPTEGIIYDWARVLMVITFVLGWLGPVIAERTAWFERRSV
jgi:hypothetical protein